MTWRSIKDDPPPKDGAVILFYTGFPTMLMGRADDWHHGAYWLSHATHWMPLPEPPA